jgi:hypothetical protein
VTVNNNIPMPAQEIIVEKIVKVPYEVTKIHEVERLEEKIVQVPQIVELPVDNYIIIRTNNVIEAFRDRPF